LLGALDATPLKNRIDWRDLVRRKGSRRGFQLTESLNKKHQNGESGT